MSDPINPKHYKHLPAEAIDIIEAAIAKAPSNESAYLQGQVLKYILRCWSKKGIEDLRKAKWYLDRMVASFDDLPAEAIETPSEPSKRYREPTLADLAKGFIECEYRGSDDAAWKAGILTCIVHGDFPFVVRDAGYRSQWNQCRIEVTE